jgi:hypothetical protein
MILDDLYVRRDEIMKRIVSQISKSLSIPILDVVRAFFVDMTLMTCWDQEENPDVSIAPAEAAKKFLKANYDR